MRLEDFEKSKSELNEKYRQNLYNSESTFEREWLLKVNDFENKIVRILGFSLFAYLVIFLCTLDAIEKVGITAIINILPTTILLPGLIQVSASLLVGAILNKIIEKIVKVRKLDKETRKKTKLQIIEERISYKIERNKKNERNYVITNALNTLKENETMLKIVSKTHYIEQKTDSIPSTLSRTEERINKLQDQLERKYKELDVQTTKRVLAREFYNVRSKFQIVVDFLTRTFGFGATATIFVSLFPTMLITSQSKIAHGLGAVLLSCFGPMLTIGTITGIHWIKRTNDYIKAFKNLNSKLGKNALPRYEKSDNEQMEIEKKIEQLADELIKTEIDIQEQKRIQEHEDEIENGIILKQKTALDYAIDGAKLFGKIDLKRDSDYKLDFIEKYAHQNNSTNETEVCTSHIKKRRK